MSAPLLVSTDFDDALLQLHLAESVQLLCKSQSPHKSVNWTFMIINMKDKLQICAGIDFCKMTLHTLYVR